MHCPVDARHNAPPTRQGGWPRRQHPAGSPNPKPHINAIQQLYFLFRPPSLNCTPRSCCDNTATTAVATKSAAEQQLTAPGHPQPKQHPVYPAFSRLHAPPNCSTSAMR